MASDRLGTGTDTEIAIVGASPAGLQAAHRLSLAGRDVTLLESRQHIGEPEPVALLAYHHLLPQDALRPAWIRRDVPRTILCHGEATIHIDAPASVLDRRRMDQDLVRQAQAAGAAVHTGVTDLCADGPHGLTWSGGAVHPRVSLFADGARSLARRWLPTLRDPERVVWGASFRVQAPVDDVTIHIDPEAPGCRTQWTPYSDDEALFWSFGGHDRDSAVRRARHHLHQAGFGPDDAVAIGAAPDPVYALPGDLVGDGLAVIGGAAGQGGLETGMRAGRMVADRLAAAWPTPRRGLQQYAADWGRRRHGARLLREATERLHRIPRATVTELMHRIGRRDVPVRHVDSLARPGLPRLRSLLYFLARAPGAAPIAWRAWRAP